MSIEIKNIEIEELYINTHSQEREEIKKINNNVKMFVVKQIGKNGVKVNVLRGIIETVRKNYIILNIYEDNITKKLFGKTLTVLTNKQLALSENMNKGEREPIIYNLNIKKVIYGESFFDFKLYSDYLNKNKKINN